MRLPHPSLISQLSLLARINGLRLCLTSIPLTLRRSHLAFAVYRSSNLPQPYSIAEVNQFGQPSVSKDGLWVRILRYSRDLPTSCDITTLINTEQQLTLQWVRENVNSSVSLQDILVIILEGSAIGNTSHGILDSSRKRIPLPNRGPQYKLLRDTNRIKHLMLPSPDTLSVVPPHLQEILLVRPWSSRPLLPSFDISFFQHTMGDESRTVSAGALIRALCPDSDECADIIRGIQKGLRSRIAKRAGSQSSTRGRNHGKCVITHDILDRATLGALEQIERRLVKTMKMPHRSLPSWKAIQDLPTLSPSSSLTHYRVMRFSDTYYILLFEN